MEEQSIQDQQPSLGAEPTTPEKPQPDFWHYVLDILETLVLALLLFAGINALSARIRVDGQSMEPNFHTGEFILVNKIVYKLGRPNVGDVVVFRYPRDPSQEFIKRVIGLPGDHIKILGGNVYVNGRALSEPYIAAPPAYDMETTVPDNSLFVMGDNRNNSSDSHQWGPLPMANVIGKAIVIYWPPSRWGLVHNPASVQAAAQ